MSTDSNLALHGEPIIVSDSTDNISPFDDPINIDNFEVKTLTFPADVTVPIIASSPSRDSPNSSVSSNSSTARTSKVTIIPTPIKWSDADLNYLLSILYPDLMMANQLVFSPPLEALQHMQGPTHLQLFVHIPDQPIPAAAFSRHAPIGTGRPISKTLLAESDLKCEPPASARESLAKSLLSDRATVNSICAKYTVMGALYAYPQVQLESVGRGIRAMAAASDGERRDRLWQLQGVVDEMWDFEPRLETYLLEVGGGELDAWVRCVEVGLGLGKEDREMWADVYREAGRFLKGACAV